ncbi:MAG: NCS2 family permease [Succinivibrio sp.]
MKERLDRYFQITKRNSSFKTELIAGFTTFMAMAYVILVNPTILEQAGIPKEAAVAATIWTSALCTLAMGLYARLPFAVAPGMGINAFFTFYVCKTVGLSWQTALGAVFISGIIFLLLTVTKVRELIIESLPKCLKVSITTGIGMFIAFVGLSNAGIVVKSDATLVTLGHMTDPKVLLSCFGIGVIAVLLALKVKAAMLLGILLTTFISMILGFSKAPSTIDDVISFEIPALTETFMQMDILGAIEYGIISIIFTFTVVELFDNIGTLVALTKASGMMNNNGKVENINKALLTDSVGTIASAVTGTCTVTTYIESSAGVQVGGRTGLTAVVVGICFLMAFILSPLALLVPPFATAPALIVVGALMVKYIAEIDFSDPTEVIPAFLTIIMMPLTYSIGNGFGFGFTAYCLMKLCTGRYKEIKPFMWIITVLFILSYINHG